MPTTRRFTHLISAEEVIGLCERSRDARARSRAACDVARALMIRIEASDRAQRERRRLRAKALDADHR
jgi:hypothetical protein